MFLEMVDNILRDTDKNNDGYLDYFEYMMAKLDAKEDDKEKTTQGNKT